MKSGGDNYCSMCGYDFTERDQLRAREKELVEALLSLTNAFDLAIAQGKLPGGTQNSQIAQAARAALSKVRGA